MITLGVDSLPLSETLTTDMPAWNLMFEVVQVEFLHIPYNVHYVQVIVQLNVHFIELFVQYTEQFSIFEPEISNKRLWKNFMRILID